MRIRFKTAGILAKYLSSMGIEGTSANLDIGEARTPAEVIDLLGMPVGDRFLVAINGTVVPPSERAKRTLAENDELAVMPPLKGG